MSGRRLCEGGVEIGTGPCAVCGRTWRENCGRPLPDPRNARIVELEAELTAARAEAEATRLKRVAEAFAGWSWIRSVMSQGADIYADYLAGKHDGYEAYSARLDAAAAEREEGLRAALQEGA